MVEPVTVFLVAIACLLAAAAAVRPLALRTRVPEAVWLIALGAAMRATGLASSATIATLAPFFAAFALVIVLFEAGRDMVFGSGGEQLGRARKLALVNAGLAAVLVAPFSQALSGLELLPTWSWTHALMLAALVLATAPEVFAPSLLTRAHPGAVATLERESALSGAVAIAATAVCIDLLSLEVPEGSALAAIAAGFGLGLAFGAFAGLLWIAAIRRVGPGRGVYPYTLAAILALYVVTDSLGGIGSLAVLVFGAVVANAGVLVAMIFRPRGAAAGEAADEDFRDALDDHARTVEITRVLLLTFVGLGLGPPWGLLAMGIVLGLLLVVLRLLAARLVLRGLDEREFSALALGWPRGMLVAGLAALPHAAQVPGTESLTTLVFSAVATTCVAFAVAVSHPRHVSSDLMKESGGNEQVGKDISPGSAAAPRPTAAPARPPSVEELLAPDRAEVPLPERSQPPPPADLEVLLPAPSEATVTAPTEVSTPAEAGPARAPDAKATFSAPTEVSPSPGAEPPARPEAGPAGAGAPGRRGERTILRGSGAGAPELVRHVFVRAADAAPVATEEPSPAEAAREGAGPVATPGAAAERQPEPPLLDLVTDALKTSGQVVPTLAEWAGGARPGGSGAKEG